MDELTKTLCSSNYAKENGVLLYNNDVYIREDTPALALLEVRRVLGRAFVPVNAVRLLDARPESGWENMEAFSKALEQAFPQLKDDLPQVADQFSINSRYFRVNYTGNTDELTLRVVSQLQVNNEAGEIVTWQRRYRMIE